MREVRSRSWVSRDRLEDEEGNDELDDTDGGGCEAEEALSGNRESTLPAGESLDRRFAIPPGEVSMNKKCGFCLKEHTQYIP